MSNNEGSAQRNRRDPEPPAFRPLPLIRNPHLQTLVARLSFSLEPPSRRELVKLEDGDQIAVEVSTPSGWSDSDRTVVLLHGLCGCHRSSYIVRLTVKLLARGLRVARMNMRGCGSGAALARNIYHSGRSEDLLAVLRHLRSQSPSSPCTVVGFSLGGNIVLKLAGELGHELHRLSELIIAVAPPMDLARCSELISATANRIYDRYFVSLLMQQVEARYRLFPDLPRISLPRGLSLREFDDRYTAPEAGFKGALDYYERCSSAALVPQIRIPCRILLARDDVFIDATTLASATLPDPVRVVCTDHGGHLGFLGWPPHSFRWMDRRLLAWISQAKDREVGPTDLRGH